MGPFLKQNNLLDLLATDKISNTEYQENLEKVYQKNWLDFLSKALLVFGIAFVLSGIVFFFAFNWDKLATPEKLLVIQTGMVLSFAGFYIKQKINPLIAQTFLFSSSVLVGVFMASFGQLYQLQADSYTLFLNWALVILPWVFLTKYYSISLLFLSLVYISVSLYMLDGARMLDTHIVMVNFPIFNAFYLFSLLALVTFLRYKKSTKVSVNFLEEKLIFIALLCICIMGIYIKFRHGMVKELNAVDYVFTATLIILASIAYFKKNISLMIAVISSVFIIILKHIMYQSDYFLELSIVLLPMLVYILILSKKQLNKIWEKNNV